jgi:cytochrome P450
MDLDLNDPKMLLRADVLQDPAEFHDLLRSSAPIWQIPGQDTYLVSDPLLIREAVRRPEDFSSNLVSIVHNDGTGCPVSFAMARFGDPVHVLSTADQPLHTRHRKMLQSHLSPATVASLEPAITGIVTEYLDQILSQDEGDFVKTFSEVIPVRTVCELIGLPPSDAPWLIDIVATVGAILDGVTVKEEMGPAIQAAFDLLVYIQEKVGQAVESAPDQRSGLLSVFAEGIEAGTVSADEARDMLLVLVSAGSETTASLLSTAVETLARDSELQARLRAHPEQIPDAIEEMLRANGPFQFHYRATPHDTSLGGVFLPANSRVLLMWAAANRPSPEERATVLSDTDDRGPAPHFAFGKGLHFCIGAPIARLEAKIALEQLLARTTAFSIAPGKSPTRRPSIFIRRHGSLPIALRSN